MKDRRKQILETSKELFNKQGYSNVTIRMIAQELNISSGNLNYHFKKREDILEALYFDMVSVFDARVQDLGTHEITLASVQADILSSMNIMVLHRFFWTDLYNLLRCNEKIKEHFQNAYEERYVGCRFLLNYLIQKGIMKAFDVENESSFLIERMIGYSNTWIYNSFIYDKEINEVYIKKQANGWLMFLEPYLTTKGKVELNKLL